LTTSRNKVLLAEFTYGGVISTTLPLDSRIPRRFYGWLKRSFLPWFYWNLLLKGRNLRETHQKREFAEQLPKAVKACVSARPEATNMLILMQRAGAGLLAHGAQGFDGGAQHLQPSIGVLRAGVQGPWFIRSLHGVRYAGPVLLR